MCVESISRHIAERVMNSEESELYRRIMTEQVTLQWLLERKAHIGGEAESEGKSPTIVREIKHQRTILSRLWDRANALKG